MRARSSPGSRSCARYGTPSGGRPPRRLTCTAPGCAASWAMTPTTPGTSRRCAASASASNAAIDHGEPSAVVSPRSVRGDRPGGMGGGSPPCGGLPGGRPPGAIMRRRLWLSAAGVAVAAVLLAAVPLLVVVGVRDPVLLALGLPLLAGAVAGSIVLAGIVSQRATRPVEELAEAAGRLGTGDPRPVGRRYGLAELDQVADGLDSVSRRVTNLLTADRELAIDASHQLRTPLTALSMRLEEMIAAADDPEVVREEGTAALAQAERLAEVVTHLLSPGRRVGVGSAGLISVDKIVLQQITEWEPAFRRAGRKMVLIGESRLQAYVTPGGLAQVIATLLDNALMHGKGTVTIRRTQAGRSVGTEAETRAEGVQRSPGSATSGAAAAARPRAPGRARARPRPWPA